MRSEIFEVVLLKHFVRHPVDTMYFKITNIQGVKF